jgi:GNAT superfamily N-acetyltransferase
MRIRSALTTDLVGMRQIMAAAIDQLQDGYLTPEQIKASHSIMGLDTQLIDDETYFVVEADGMLLGCGGWSRRATLYGGDHSAELREPRLLDPAHEAARVRAMYTHPAHARRGVGRLLLGSSEKAAKNEGFRTVELMATLSGEPLYRAAGYYPTEHLQACVDDVAVPLIRMRKTL